jgi:hypothetical protein
MAGLNMEGANEYGKTILNVADHWKNFPVQEGRDALLYKLIKNSIMVYETRVGSFSGII